MAVYDRNFGIYQGERTPTWSRFLIIPRYAYQEVFQSRLFVAFLGFCFLLPFAGLLIIYLHHNLAALSFIKADTVKLLGVGSARRWNVFPDKPTISESGVPGYEALTWFGLFAPAGTPQAIVDQLNGKLNAALVTSAKENFAKLGLDAAGGAPDVLAKQVQDEIKKWVAVARDKNIRVEP